MRDASVTAATVADAVWDEASTGHVDAGKAGAQMWTDVDAILADTGTDGVVVASLNAGAITAAAIATGAIDADAIADNAIDAASIATGAITAAKFAAGAIDAASLAADAGTEIAAAVGALVVEGTTTVKQSLQLSNALAAGKLDGAATTTIHLRDLADSKNRITATVDSSGNREAVSTSPD